MGIDLVAPLVIKQDGQIFNSTSYTQALDAEVLPWMAAINGLVLVEDKASWHTSSHTKDVFNEYKIKRKFIGGYWKDLNWMEKVWANSKNIVYKDGKEYQDKNELERAVGKAWTQLTEDSEYRRRLIFTFESACRKVVHNRGHFVNWS